MHNFGLYVFIEYLARGEVNQLDMVVRVKDDIAWLQVSVDNLHLSEVLEGDDDLRDHVLRQNVVEASLSP